MKEHKTIVEEWDSFTRSRKFWCLETIGIATMPAKDYAENYSWSTLPEEVQDKLQKEYPGYWKKR